LGNKITQQKGKTKQPTDYERRLRTQPTNKFMINTKDLFDPYLKEGKPISIEDEDPEDTLDVTSKETVTIQTLKDMCWRHYTLI
jgi:hypothetical protein